MKRESIEAVIRGLMESDNRPEGIGPTEILLVIVLVVKGAIEKPVRASHTTLGIAIGAGDSTVKRSVNVLRSDKIGWVHKQSGKGRQNANLYTVILEKLPVGQELQRTIVTPAMQLLAKQYAHATKITPDGKKRRFTPATMQRMAFTFQWFLERHCKGDEALLRATLRVALSSPTYRVKAYRGPHMLRRDFQEILAEAKQRQTGDQTQETGKAA